MFNPFNYTVLEIDSMPRHGEEKSSGKDRKSPPDNGTAKCLKEGSVCIGVPGEEKLVMLATNVWCRKALQQPPWRQPRGKSVVSFVNSRSNAISRRKHLWEIVLRFALGLPAGWGARTRSSAVKVFPGTN
jgi:hypothetical protein